MMNPCSSDHVSLRTGSADSRILETGNEFAIKACVVLSIYKTPNQAYQLLEDKVLLKLDWAKNQKTQTSLNKTVALSDEDSCFVIQSLETKFDRLADKQSGRPSGSLSSNTQPNPRGNNSKAYQPPKSRNEHVNVVFTRSGKSYDPPDNPNNQQNNSKTPINFNSDDEEEEPTP
ncbi:hypothetical protein Tco_0226572 [Tanacetum coccineum]